ncbi:palmitoyltransferase ZDHHC4 isoform 3-T5 [Acridotheres tristis]
MERVVGVWKCPGGFGVPIPGGARGVSGFTGLGTGRSLDWVGLEVFSSLKDFGILCLHLGSHRDKRNTALRAGAAASLSSGNARICCRDQELLLFHSRLGMDFLTLFLIYLCFVLAVTALLCLCSGRKESFLTRSINRASQVLSLVIPTQLQRVTHQALHRLFHTRSCLFMVLHVALQAAVFGEYTWEVFVYCWELQFHLVLLLLPYLLLAGNLGCFLLCSRANPGTVTKSNAASLVKVYAYDGVLFQRGLVCPTCTVEKPARSKHCRYTIEFICFKSCQLNPDCNSHIPSA